MSGPARLAALSTYPLNRRQGGGPLRGAHLLAALCGDGEVTARVVSVTVDPARVGDFDVAKGVTERVVLRSEAHRHAEDRLRMVTGPVSITDVAVSLLWPATPALRSELNRSLEGVDAVQFVQPYLATAVARLAPDLPTICDEHNDEVALKRRIYPDNEGGRWLLDRVEDTERLAVSGAALITATTDADLKAVVGKFGLSEDRVAIVPNGVDTAAIPFTTGAQRRATRQVLMTELGIESTARRLALFIGSAHGPNIEAGRSLVSAAAHLHDIEFLLVGRHSTQLGRVPRRAGNVHLLGEVTDAHLELLLGGADVALNPMTTGGGSNLKLLTYLAAGLPVVTTSVGARGLDVPAAGVVVAEVEGLGAGIEQALVGGGGERASAGRAYVQQHCDWSAIGARYARLVRDKVLS
jgi:glycosyltransferase involved in cell wall biosynthesis